MDLKQLKALAGITLNESCETPTHEDVALKSKPSIVVNGMPVDVMLAYNEGSRSWCAATDDHEEISQTVSQWTLPYIADATNTIGEVLSDLCQFIHGETGIECQVEMNEAMMNEDPMKYAKIVSDEPQPECSNDNSDCEMSELLKLSLGEDTEDYKRAKARLAELDNEEDVLESSDEYVAESVIRFKPGTTVDDWYDSFVGKGTFYNDDSDIIPANTGDDHTVARLLVSDGVPQGIEIIDANFQRSLERVFQHLAESVSALETSNDPSNGYDIKHEIDADDYFPNGAANPVVSHTGPNNQGDNPMQKAIKDNKKDDALHETERKEIHNRLLSEYQLYLGESSHVIESGENDADRALQKVTDWIIREVSGLETADGRSGWDISEADANAFAIDICEAVGIESEIDYEYAIADGSLEDEFDNFMNKYFPEMYDTDPDDIGYGDADFNADVFPDGKI